jgi:glycosyltransferase involved in cell wall biosynthesis
MSNTDAVLKSPELNRPLVSIGMPVWNGESFLAEAIQSLLSQDYTNIELVILDNMSTDKTGEICLSFAVEDNRVRYILDNRPRDVIEAFTEIACLVSGEYFMVGADDDVYDRSYISSLMNILLADTSLGLAYAGCNTIHPDGSVNPSIWTWRLTKHGSRFSNFIKYFFKRNPIPICFGIMKTSVHRDGLQYFYRPDNRGWNHDNLYVLRILSTVKVDSIPDRLFYYRERDRASLYTKRGQRYGPDSGLALFKKTFLHQLSVSKVAIRIVSDSKFSLIEKWGLKIYILFCTLYFSAGYKILIPVIRPVHQFFLKRQTAKQ